jgi:hypothetical protein
VKILGVELSEIREHETDTFHVGRYGDLEVMVQHTRDESTTMFPWSVYVEARIDDVRIQLVAHRDSMAAAEAAAEAALRHVPALAAMVEAARKSQEGRAA